MRASLSPPRTPQRVLDNAPSVEKPPDFEGKEFLRSLDDPLHRFVSGNAPVSPHSSPRQDERALWLVSGRSCSRIGGFPAALRLSLTLLQCWGSVASRD